MLYQLSYARVKRNPSRCTAGKGPRLAGGLLQLLVLDATA
jgi:hypothetical protein